MEGRLTALSAKTAKRFLRLKTCRPHYQCFANFCRNT